jgi:hypothetical protein
VPATFAPSPTPAVVSSGLNDLFELSTGIGMAPGGYVAPKAVSNELTVLSQWTKPLLLTFVLLPLVINPRFGLCSGGCTRKMKDGFKLNNRKHH